MLLKDSWDDEIITEQAALHNNHYWSTVKPGNVILVGDSRRRNMLNIVDHAKALWTKEQLSHACLHVSPRNWLD